MTCRNLIPTRRRVATPARFFEPSRVRIAVARRARTKLQAGKTDNAGRIFPVALPALDFSVKPCQREPRRVVVIPWRRLPTIHRVTAETTPCELPLVSIGMAGRALARQSQVCPRLECCTILQDIFCLDVVPPVALGAWNPEMHSLECEPDSGVVERRHIEPDERKIPPMMLFVAFHAVPSLVQCMEPGPGRNPRLDFGVTAQTPVIRDHLPQSMARRTIPHPFQAGMCPGELSRGNLGMKRSPHKSDGQNADDCQSEHFPSPTRSTYIQMPQPPQRG